MSSTKKQNGLGGGTGYPEVRILPMSDSDEEFAGYQIDTLQRRYFLEDLPFKYAGKYCYQAQGLSAVSGSLVLFQFKSRIVASAVFLETDKTGFPKGDYTGALVFDSESICVFHPIDAAVMKTIWPDDFPGFTQSKTRLNPDQIKAFEKRLTSVRTPKPNVDELRDQFDQQVTELQGLSEAELLARIEKSDPKPRRREATAFVYDRDPLVVVYVLQRAGGVCERCNQPASFIRKSDQTPYLEVHHIIRLADDGPDTPDNAQALCPNCHREVHYG